MNKVPCPCPTAQADKMQAKLVALFAAKAIGRRAYVVVAGRRVYVKL